MPGVGHLLLIRQICFRERSDRYPKPEELACAEMPPGSAVVYLGSTIHGGGQNATQTVGVAPCT